MEKIIGIDSCNQNIVPKNKNIKLTIHTNCHPNCNGSSWGWIEGCTLNICWSDNKTFNYKIASELVNNWNSNI